MASALLCVVTRCQFVGSRHATHSLNRFADSRELGIHTHKQASLTCDAEFSTKTSSSTKISHRMTAQLAACAKATEPGSSARNAYTQLKSATQSRGAMRRESSTLTDLRRQATPSPSKRSREMFWTRSHASSGLAQSHSRIV
ncbi:hypothetical protein CC79DRAFT_455300 [Sarocladium strictum]